MADPQGAQNGEGAAAPSNAKVYPLQRPTRKVRAVAFMGGRKEKAKKDPEPGESAQTPPVEDVWKTLEAAGRVIEPPYDPLFLSSLNEGSSDLGHMVEAMVTNVVGYGWSLTPVPGVASEADDALKVEIEDEWERIDVFLEHGNFEPYSLTETRRRNRTDFESVGYSFLELVQNGVGEITGYVHAPAHRMRLTPVDDEATLFYETVPVGRGPRRRLEQRPKRRRFRRYVQIDPATNRIVYFKELGDPRPISRETGQVLTGPDAENPRLRANPMLYRSIYAPRTPYGIPRWIGSLLAILGSRSAEEVNYTTLANNQIPSMALLVSNGQLTDESVDRIEEFTAEIGSDENWSKILLIEAEPDGEGEGGQVRIEMLPMRQGQHEDAMFKEYEAGNLEKVRRSWRMPPIISGSSSDYTRSTSDTSRKLAEEQTFEPARREEDWDWNRVLYAMGMRFHQFRSNSPNVTNDEDLIKVMSAAEKSGAMTPRIALKLLSDILGMELEGLDETRVPMDVPYSLTMAEAVKNLAQPTEPGQQVTALKLLQSAGGGVETLIDIRDRLLAEFARREKILARGGVPGFVVDSAKADRVLAGIDTTVTLTEKREIAGVPLVLCDDVCALGWVELSDPEETADGWTYRVTDSVPIEPQKHTLSAGAGEFVDSVEIRGAA